MYNTYKRVLLIDYFRMAGIIRAVINKFRDKFDKTFNPIVIFFEETNNVFHKIIIHRTYFGTSQTILTEKTFSNVCLSRIPLNKKKYFTDNGILIFLALKNSTNYILNISRLARFKCILILHLYHIKSYPASKF